MKVTFPLPYFNQYDNKLYPGGSCNLTCVAMAMAKYGLPGPKMGYARLPDNLLAYADANKLSRHSLDDMDKIAERFGLKDHSSYCTSFADIKKHVKNGKPVIVHGVFTPSGHIVAIRGIDESKGLWHVNDPAGRWNNGYRDYSSGEGVWYQSEWFRKMIAPDGCVWAHLLN
jgi:hypothetical protein